MRLTPDNPSGLFQGFDNCFYIKDGEVMVRGGVEAPCYNDISLLDLMRVIAADNQR